MISALVNFCADAKDFSVFIAPVPQVADSFLSEAAAAFDEGTRVYQHTVFLNHTNFQGFSSTSEHDFVRLIVHDNDD